MRISESRCTSGVYRKIPTDNNIQKRVKQLIWTYSMVHVLAPLDSLVFCWSREHGMWSLFVEIISAFDLLYAIKKCAV